MFNCYITEKNRSPCFANRNAEFSWSRADEVDQRGFGVHFVRVAAGDGNSRQAGTAQLRQRKHDSTLFLIYQ